MISRLSVALSNITSDEVTRVYRGEEVEDSVLYNDDKCLKRVNHYWNVILLKKTAADSLKFPTLKENDHINTEHFYGKKVTQ